MNSADSYTILGNELFITDGTQVFIYRATELPVEEGVDLTALDGTFWYLVSMESSGAHPRHRGYGRLQRQPGRPDRRDLRIGRLQQLQRRHRRELHHRTGGHDPEWPCQFPPGVMEQENAYLAALQGATSYSIAGEQLLINTASGVLTYSANQPANRRSTRRPSCKAGPGTWSPPAT